MPVATKDGRLVKGLLRGVGPILDSQRGLNDKFAPSQSIEDDSNIEYKTALPSEKTEIITGQSYTVDTTSSSTTSL